jgi:hypothetical protein
MKNLKAFLRLLQVDTQDRRREHDKSIFFSTFPFQHAIFFFCSCKKDSKLKKCFPVFQFLKRLPVIMRPRKGGYVVCRCTLPSAYCHISSITHNLPSTSHKSLLILRLHEKYFHLLSGR